MMSRVERWEHRTEVPLLLLALAFLVAYAWPVIDPELDRDLRGFLFAGSWTLWAAFAADFGIRLALAKGGRKHYALTHWYDVLLVLVPLLRPLRLLRLVAVIRIFSRTAAGSLNGRVLMYSIGVALVSMMLGALATLDVEQDAKGANITTFPNAIWWATNTVTTVGYGDFYPITPQGRLVAAGLMLVGIGVVGGVTAAFAAWLVQAASREKSNS
jgi:voltage-gated potassium channel